MLGVPTRVRCELSVYKVNVTVCSTLSTGNELIICFCTVFVPVVTVKLFDAPSESLNKLLLSMVQYKVVPDSTLVVVMVYVIVCPALGVPDATMV